MLVRNQRIVVASGGFDPVHSGHILLLNSAKTYGDYLVVGVNSDDWLTRKKGKAFMPYNERSAIVSNLKSVDEVMKFDDSDNSACDLLEKVKTQYPGHPIIFVNGGDRTPDNIPELSIKDIIFKFGVGGSHKKNSSSIILEDWLNPKTIRTWGWYKVLDDKKIYKVKELVIQPGQQLSMQKHAKRDEHWFVLKGECVITTEYKKDKLTVAIKESNCYNIGAGVWHQATNQSDRPCHILEVQFGDVCEESDIERKE